jgi:4-amino-4-deoxy-L-arabinose transferase-like glycosyltransferase
MRPGRPEDTVNWRHPVRLSVRLLARLLLAAVLVDALWRFGGKAFAFLRSPWSRDYGEGCVLAMVQLLAERGTYFTGFRDYPFVHGNYPPLFILLNWPFYAVLGPSLIWPRLLSLAATAVLVAVVAVFGRRITGSWTTGGVMAALTLVPWFVQTWAPMGRVDMLALSLSAAGLGLATRAGREGVPWAAFACLWLAFFTKQNALLAPAALLLHRLLEGDRRRFVREAAAFVLPLAILFGALVAATGGLAWRHLITYTAAADYEWPRMLESYGEFLLLTAPFQVLVLVGLLFLRSRVWTGTTRVLVLYWALNGIGLATIAKSGAAQNYFIEPWLATLLAAAAVGRQVLESRPTLALAGELALGLAALLAAHGNPKADRLPQAIRNPQAARDLIAVEQAVQETAEPILSENLSLLVVNGKPVLVEPYGVWMLTKTGLFRPDRIVDDCEHGRFGLVVVEYRLRQVPGLGECLDRRYAPANELGPYQLLRPRGTGIRSR